MSVLLYSIIPAALIAFAALAIACFAIAGYISFQNGSIPDSALDNKHGFTEDVLFDKNVNVVDTITATEYLLGPAATGLGVAATGFTLTTSGFGNQRVVTLTNAAAIPLNNFITTSSADTPTNTSTSTPVFTFPKSEGLTILSASATGVAISLPNNAANNAKEGFFAVGTTAARKGAGTAGDAENAFDVPAPKANILPKTGTGVLTITGTKKHAAANNTTRKGTNTDGLAYLNFAINDLDNVVAIDGIKLEAGATFTIEYLLD